MPDAAPKFAVMSLTSENFDLTNVGQLNKFCKEVQVKFRFPFSLICPNCEHKITIRALDDFPTQSIICTCKETYLLKLTKVKNGNEKVL